MDGTLASLITSPAARAAMATRPELITASAANAEAALFPNDPGGLSHGERLHFAARIAALNGDAALADRYRALGDGAPVPTSARLAALERHVDLLTKHPREATSADIAALAAAGVADADIVRLSQVIAFVNYEVRVLAGLRLIGA